MKKRLELRKQTVALLDGQKGRIFGGGRDATLGHGCAYPTDTVSYA